MKQAHPVYIGFDSTQATASRVCEYSLVRRSSEPVIVRHLMRDAVTRAGLYERPYTIRGGQSIDDRDGKPFSTEFSFSRFLIPALNLFQGWALFCDGDFLFLDDIAKVFALADPKYAVMCVKHAHDPAPAEQTKMDGRAQTRYRRKNWSSFVLWNCAHPAHRGLATNAVNHQPGSWLHAFSWLADDEIGEIPPEWNHLVGVNKLIPNPSGVHFTLGGPWFSNHDNVPFAEDWRNEKRAYFADTYPGIALVA